jgi:MFS family permease
MSLHQSSVYAGTVAGSWFAAWLAEHYGWRLGFYFFGSAGILLAVVLYLFLREPRRGEAEAMEKNAEVMQETPPSVMETVQLILQKPTVILLMAAFLGANFVATIFLTWTPTFLVEKFGFKLAAAGLSGSAFIHLASAVSVPVGGLLADRLAKRLAGGRILVQAGGLLVGAAFVMLIGTTQQKSTLLFAMAMFGLCKGLYDANIFASVYDAIEPRARSTAAGVMNTVGWGGGALGPVVVGWLAKHGKYSTEIENMSHAIAWTGIIYIGGAVILVIAAVVFAPGDVLGGTVAQE